MSINISIATLIFVALGSAVPAFGGLFVVLRYVIRAETSELRNNGGSTMKDKVERTVKLAEEAKVSADVAATKATKSADMAERSAHVASATKDALDEHVEQSRVMVEQGAADKAALWLNAEEHTRAITELAKAVQIAAQSTPPEEHSHV